MSLPEFSPQLGLFTAEQFVADDFDPADPFRLFFERIYPLLIKARSTLAQMYCRDNGRPGIEPVVLLGVSILQFMYRLPDRAAADNLKYHLGWKLALARPLGLESFDASVLVYFRQRLLAHEQSKLAFDVILGGLKEAGLVRANHKQRLDSTHVLGLVARLSAAERLGETLRLALLELAGRSQRQPEFFGELQQRYVEQKLDWQLSQQQLADRFQLAGCDMLRLLTWLKAQDPASLQLASVKLLERVLYENFQQEAETLTPCDQPPGAVKNPNDPDAQWARKSSTQWVGYKVQVAETLEDRKLQPGEPTGSFLTAMTTQQAIGSDEAGLEAVRKEQHDSGLTPPPALHVDGAYVSAKVLKEEAEAGRELIGPAQAPANKGPGFKSDQFDVHLSERFAVCPAGHRSTNCSKLTEQDTGNVSYRIEWSGVCAGCPLASGCLGRNQAHRTLAVGEHHEHLQSRRREQKTDAFKERMRKRNAIEGTQSELVRAHGLRQARYRGLWKVRLQNYLIGAACNAKRWVIRAAWEIRQAPTAGLATSN